MMNTPISPEQDNQADDQSASAIQTSAGPAQQQPGRLRVWLLDAYTSGVDLPFRGKVRYVERDGNLEDDLGPNSQSGATSTRHVTFAIAGPGIRLASEALDFLLICSLAIVLSIFIELPWARRAEVQPLAAIADSVATTVTGTKEGPNAAALKEQWVRLQATSWIVLVLAAFLLFPVLLNFFGMRRSPGMILLGLQPISLDDGCPPTMSAWSARNFGRILDVLPLFFLTGLGMSMRDPLGARRFLGEQLSNSALIRTNSFSTDLSLLGIPRSAYGTAELGYLAEALLLRLPSLSPERGHSLARRLADTIIKNHPDEISPELKRLADRNEPIPFLRELVRQAAKQQD